MNDLQVISAMVLVKLEAGATVIHQGALPGARDCMYLLASGSVDIVITGGGNQGAKNEVRVVSLRMRMIQLSDVSSVVLSLFLMRMSCLSAG